MFLYELAVFLSLFAGCKQDYNMSAKYHHNVTKEFPLNGNTNTFVPVYGLVIICFALTTGFIFTSYKLYSIFVRKRYMGYEMLSSRELDGTLETERTRLVVSST